MPPECKEEHASMPAPHLPATFALRVLGSEADSARLSGVHVRANGLGIVFYEPMWQFRNHLPADWRKFVARYYAEHTTVLNAGESRMTCSHFEPPRDQRTLDRRSLQHGLSRNRSFPRRAEGNPRWGGLSLFVPAGSSAPAAAPPVSRCRTEAGSAPFDAGAAQHAHAVRDPYPHKAVRLQARAGGRPHRRRWLGSRAARAPRAAPAAQSGTHIHRRRAGSKQ
jgi:hypothetical protein